MPTQSELFPSEESQTPEVIPASSAAGARVRATEISRASASTVSAVQRNHRQPRSGKFATPAPLWLQRISLAVLVTFCIYIGLLLLCLPWTHFWDQNPLLMAYPPLTRLLLRGATRGVVSGLGLLDLWIGCSEVLHFTPRRRQQDFAKIPIRTMQKP
jgi:hypothetical protein